MSALPDKIVKKTRRNKDLHTQASYTKKNGLTKGEFQDAVRRGDIVLEEDRLVSEKKNNVVIDLRDKFLKEKVREQVARADIAEMKAMNLRKELIPYDDVTKMFKAIFDDTDAFFRKQASNLSSLIKGKSPREIDGILKEQYSLFVGDIREKTLKSLRNILNK